MTSFVQAERNAGRNVMNLLLQNPDSNVDPVVFSSDEATSTKPQLAVTR